MKKEINILATIDLSEEARAQVLKLGDGINLSVILTNDQEDIPEDRWAETEVLFTQGTLPDPEKAPKLNWIQFNSVGVDRFTNHPLFENKRIVATSMSGAIASQVAEYVLMTLLAFGQKLPKLLADQRKKYWPNRKERWGALLPLALRDSTVGIIGYGSIGRQIARLLVPFNATILAAKKDVMHPEQQGYIPDGMGDPQGDFFDRLYPLTALHSLLSECDFVVLTLPLTKLTRHIIDDQAFEAMKSTAYLVNVGRGQLIDQEALMDALKSKQIAGAALDVFEKEPLPEDSPLWEMENVIITPHIAGVSRHFDQETLTLFIENLKRYRDEMPLYNRIDVDEGY